MFPFKNTSKEKNATRQNDEIGKNLPIVHTSRLLNQAKPNYSTIRKRLQKSVEYKTFQLKEDRPFRIIIKNLHPITDPKKIAQELKAIGHETSKLPYNIKHKATKQPLLIFFFNLLSKSNNKEIYSLDNS
ncbi:RNA-directed DNA polymerase from mobile element jockey [Vespula squamosa]|uniref:RNA-directed DNA polymerase from mobile element jockey n=1 Tax=Vespula squamosa TaxID=30214 RepID=A0ABD2BGE6_VESSQ